ncbi:MAG: DUF4446 family protein [Firmicutes bacterium]|jgi:hypothetical protein|nr:DUF4446 family protein [Bacillota bacterium]MCL5012733.1 DUF4446 family protein [Bacillota bacterium]
MLSGLPVNVVMISSLIIALVSLIVAILSWSSASRVKRRITRVLRGGGINIEESLAKTYDEAATAKQAASEFDQRLSLLESKQAQTLSKFGLVRFNPFDDTGADLSFSLALLNEYGDGVVMTSLWGRNEVRLYAKPVIKRDSRYALSQEERSAIDLAATTRLSKDSHPAETSS